VARVIAGTALIGRRWSRARGGGTPAEFGETVGLTDTAICSLKQHAVMPTIQARFKKKLIESMLPGGWLPSDAFTSINANSVSTSPFLGYRPTGVGYTVCSRPSRHRLCIIGLWATGNAGILQSVASVRPSVRPFLLQVFLL